MTKIIDDLEAVRTIIQVLESFDSKDRERIIRWAKEKLGMQPTGQTSTTPKQDQSIIMPPAGSAATGVIKDIKSFISEKSPKNDMQLAAAVAYYYHFEAPEGQQKEFITSEDLLDACRKADCTRPTNPGQTLRNAFQSGLLDRAGEKGQFRLNAVGENLVAMVLPEGEGGGSVKPAKKTKKKPTQKKPTKKVTTSKKEAKDK